jgi:hypothetical protein
LRIINFHELNTQLKEQRCLYLKIHYLIVLCASPLSFLVKLPSGKSCKLAHATCTVSFLLTSFSPCLSHRLPLQCSKCTTLGCIHYAHKRSQCTRTRSLGRRARQVPRGFPVKARRDATHLCSQLSSFQLQRAREMIALKTGVYIIGKCGIRSIVSFCCLQLVQKYGWHL